MNKRQFNKIINYLKPKFDQWFPEGWFITGSSYLVMNDIIDRDIHDIDIMTKANHYNDGNGYSDQQDLLFFNQDRGSCKFTDQDGNVIKVFKLQYQGIIIDVMFNPTSNEDNIIEQIIKYKSQAILNVNTDEVKSKHLCDLELINKSHPEFEYLISKYYFNPLMRKKSNLARGII